MHKARQYESGTALVARRVLNYRLLILLVVAMFAAEITMHFTHSTWSRWIITATAITAVALACGAGLRLRDLGLSPDTLGRSARWAGAIILIVVIVIAVGLLAPPIRELFQNDAYRNVSGAVVSAFILIPLQTVLPEELLFRGVILGALLRRHSAAVAITVQAVLFGLWHVVSSIGLSEGNQGIGNVVGPGTLGATLGVLAAVGFTAAAGAVMGWLRVKTGSILPAIALHWVSNGAGAVAAALAWQFT